MESAASIFPSEDPHRGRGLSMAWFGNMAALAYLLRAQCWGRARRAVRRMGSPKRAFLTVGAAMVFAVWIAQELTVLHAAPSLSSAEFVAHAPAILLGLLGAKLLPLVVRRDLAGIRLRSTDANLLLAAPFTMQQVRLYKVAGHLLSITVTAVFASFFLWRSSASWLHAYVGSLWSMTSIYLFYLWIATLVTYARRHTYHVLRVVVTLAVLAWGYSVLRLAMTEGGSSGDLSALASVGWDHLVQISHSEYLVVPSAPFRLLAGLFHTHPIVPRLLILVLAATAMNTLVLTLTLVSESWLIWRGARREQRYFQRHPPAPQALTSQRIACDVHTRYLVPCLPWLGGAGPIIWRQVCAVRSHLGTLAGITLVLGGLLVCFLRSTNNIPSQVDFSAWLLLVFLTNIILPGFLPFDFRSDHDRMALLQRLPISSFAVTLGQLTVPVLITFGFQGVMLVVWWFLYPAHGWALWVGPLFLIPLNVLFLSLENTIFLLYPYHPGEIGFHATIGRVVQGAARIGLFALAAFAAIAFAYVTLWIVQLFPAERTASRSFRIALSLWWIGGGWCCVAGAAGGMAALLGYVYARFDARLDGPLQTT